MQKHSDLTNNKICKLNIYRIDYLIIYELLGILFLMHKFHIFFHDFYAFPRLIIMIFSGSSLGPLYVRVWQN